MKRFLVVFLLGTTTPVIAQTTKVPVSLSVSSANDNVVERIAFAFKEGVRHSSSMTLVPAGREALIHVSIVAVPVTPNSYSSYAISWSLRGPEKALSYYLTTSAATCGTLRVKECAESILAATDVEAANWGWANAPLANQK